MRGYTAEETGQRQFIATATVKAHRTNLMRVLGATSMTQAVAIYLGWEDDDELATVTPLWDLASDGTEAGARRVHPAGKGGR